MLMDAENFLADNQEFTTSVNNAENMIDLSHSRDIFQGTEKMAMVITIKDIDLNTTTEIFYSLMIGNTTDPSGEELLTGALYSGTLEKTRVVVLPITKAPYIANGRYLKALLDPNAGSIIASIAIQPLATAGASTTSYAGVY